MDIISKYIGIHFKSQIEYKISFILSLISQLLSFMSYFFIIYSLFNRFGNLKEFSIYEVLLVSSIIQLAFSVSETFGRGFDRFSNLIIKGSFDILLIRPRNIYLQIFGSQLALEKSSRIINAIVMLVISIIKINVNFSLIEFIIILLMIIGAVIIFISIFILGASMSFVTIQGLEFVNIFTDGSKEFGQYPMGIYKKNILLFFTFIIPLACINYYPLLFITNKSNNILYGLSPLVSILFIIPSILIFNYGISKYKSTGS